MSPWGLTSAFLFMLAVATGIAFLGKLWWVFDLASSCRPQYLAASLVLAIAFAAGRKGKLVLTAMTAAIINAWVLAPLYFGPEKPQATSERDFRVILMNVHTANRQFQRVLDLIDAEVPDFVLLIEIDDEWVSRLKPLRAIFEHHIEEPSDDNFGIGFYSKLPLKFANVIDLGPAAVPSIQAQLSVNGAVLTIIGTHPLPPGSKENWKLRNEQLAQLGSRVKDISGELLVLGDLNVTPWSNYFSQLLDHGNLQDARRGFGVIATWPSWAGALGIPIDHCLVSRGVAVEDVRAGPKIGSDHLPLILDLYLKRPISGKLIQINSGQSTVISNSPFQGN